MDTRVGVLGAGSFVARSFILQTQKSHEVAAFPRSWPSAPIASAHASPRPIGCWASFMPITALLDRLDAISVLGARRIVVLSSTSMFAKAASSEPSERLLSRDIADSEQRLAAWAQRQSVQWIIIRPTLIYGHGRDRNVSDIARFIRRFGFFPVVGAAQGRRQPVHCEDVAGACLRALEAIHISNRAYDISGGEIVSYREMVTRVFEALGERPRLISVPLWFYSRAIACARMFPRWRHWSPAMAQRMNEDLLFDHSLAARDLQFSPRAFLLNAHDLPPDGQADAAEDRQ